MARRKPPQALPDVEDIAETPSESVTGRVSKAAPTKLICVYNNLTNAVTGTQYSKSFPVHVDPALVEEGAKSWESVQIAAGLLRVI